MCTGVLRTAVPPLCHPLQPLAQVPKQTSNLRILIYKVVVLFSRNIESPDQLRPALDRAAASGKPALVNVVIRQDREYGGGIYV